MNSLTENKKNPFLNNKIESLCIVCNKDLGKCEGKSVQDVLPRAKTITVFQALKLLSNFHQLNIETETLKICYKCFPITELAFGFQMLCNKSVESLKEYIDHQDAVNCNIEDETQNNDLIQELVLVQNENIDDCDNLIADDVMQTDDTVEVYEEEDENYEEGCDEEKKQDSIPDSCEITEEVCSVPRKKRERRAASSRSECPHCHKIYRHDYLRIHIRSHTGERPYKCKICGKSFKTPNSYTHHMLVHEDKRPFLCPFCGRTFRLNALLKEHIRMHTGERPHVCNVCGKAFRTNNSLKRHETVHSDERPFKCDECAKCFTLKRLLKQHQVVHAKVKPIECTFCGRRFSQRHVLRTHQAKSCQAIHS